MEQLSDHDVGDTIVDRRAEEHDALADPPSPAEPSCISTCAFGRA